MTSVGRHRRSDIFLDDVTVSRRHVELRWEKDDFHVTSPGHSAANSVSSATAATKPPRSRLSQHRFWHHCGDGCAFEAGSQ